MKVVCPACRAQVPAEAINIAAMTAVCRGCSEVFAIAGAGAGSAIPPAPASRPRYVVHDELSGGGLRLAWGWWRWGYLFLACFAAAWDGFLVFWYAAALSGLGRSGTEHAWSWFAILFPVAHVAVGVGLTYFLVAAVFNCTTIDLDGQTLRVRHGPVPWLGNRELAREQIRRLKLSRIETASSGRISTVHGLLAELDPDGQTQLVRSFRDREHACYVGQALAAAVGVPLVEN